jgi:DNA polymerase III alpha subunit
MDISSISVQDADKYNKALMDLYLDWPRLQKQQDISPEKFHSDNQKIWMMPQEYQDLDIAALVLSKCADQNELQRAGEELLAYAQRDLLGMLCYLLYLVDTAKANDIVLGVGRGSSVASFVLYLLGVHRIHSLRHNLDFQEFMR